MLKLEDYKIGSHIDLAKLVGKEIANISGYITTEFGDPTFQLSRIIFTDGTFLWVEGEHDLPYVVDGDCKLDSDLMTEIRNAEDE